MRSREGRSAREKLSRLHLPQIVFAINTVPPGRPSGRTGLDGLLSRQVLLITGLDGLLQTGLDSLPLR